MINDRLYKLIFCNGLPELLTRLRFVRRAEFLKDYQELIQERRSKQKTRILKYKSMSTVQKNVMHILAKLFWTKNECTALTKRKNGERKGVLEQHILIIFFDYNIYTLRKLRMRSMVQRGTSSLKFLSTQKISGWIWECSQLATHILASLWLVDKLNYSRKGAAGSILWRINSSLDLFQSSSFDFRYYLDHTKKMESALTAA